MTRRLVIRPPARLDLLDAQDWCEGQSPSLGQRMLREFDLAIATIVENPFLYQIVVGKLRRAPLQSLGYGVFYLVSDKELVVVGFFHGRQNPSRLRGRT